MLASFSPSCTLLFSHMKAFALSKHTRSFTPPIILSHCFTCVLLTSATSLCKNVMSTSRHTLNSTYSGKVFCLPGVCSCSIVSNSLWPHGVKLTRLLCPWDFPGKNTAVGCHFLLQGIFWTQGSNCHFPFDKSTGSSIASPVPGSQSLSSSLCTLYS